tara:strand:+ start:199 stop:462 length:264 start_codon:yes stop_codon:yes gene_type:complete
MEGHLDARALKVNRRPGNAKPVGHRHRIDTPAAPPAAKPTAPPTAAEAPPSSAAAAALPSRGAMGAALLCGTVVVFALGRLSVGRRA